MQTCTLSVTLCAGVELWALGPDASCKRIETLTEVIQNVYCFLFAHMRQYFALLDHM